MTPLHRLLLKFIIRIQDPSQVQCLSRNVDLLTDSTSSPLWVLQLLPKKVLCISLNSRILVQQLSLSAMRTFVNSFWIHRAHTFE